MLPPDVIAHGILPFLKVREIRNLTDAFSTCWPHLWKHVISSFHFSSQKSKVTFDDVYWLVSNGIKLVQVNIVLEHNAYDDANAYQLSRLPLQNSLSTLKELTMSRFGNQTTCIAENAPNLEILKCFGGNITDTSFIPMAHRCSMLHYFHIERSNITDASIRALCNQCPFLRSLHFNECSNLTNESLFALTNVGWRLESLYFKSCNFSDDAIALLLSKCTTLQRLCMYIGQTIIGHIWSTIPHLRCIHLKNRLLSDDLIVQLARTCSYLQVLHVYDFKTCSDLSILALVQHCLYLKDLQFFNFGPIPLSPWALSSTFYSLHDNCWHQGEEFEHGLCLMACPYLSDECLLAYASSNRDLQHLHLASCKQITDIGLQTIAHYCTSIRHLLLQGCSITRAGIRELIIKNCNIVELELNRVEILSADISAVVKHCLHLEAIYLECCFKVTHSAILALLVHCPTLRIMDIKDCMSIKLKQITKILMNRKKLRHGETLNWRFDEYHGKCQGDGK